MAKTNNLGDFLKDVADGIRTARGATGSIAAQNFRTEIEKLKPSNYISVTIDGVPQTSNLAFTSSETWDHLSTLPKKVSGEFFLHNGKLCYNSDYNIYQFDDSTKTWSQIATGLSSSNFVGWCRVYSVNGTLVAIGNSSASNHAIKYSYYTGSNWTSYSSLSGIYAPYATLLVYNNTLYLVGAYYASGYRYRIYKWENNKFNVVVSDLFGTMITDETYVNAVVHNGLIHIFGYNGNYRTFDGTNVVTMHTAAPYSNLISYEGNIHSFQNRGHYVLNSDGSWTLREDLTGIVGSSYTLSTAIVYNNKIHIADSNTNSNSAKHYISNKTYFLNT